MSNHFIAFWNVENLFAPEGFPDREPWIAAAVSKDLKGWSPDIFNRKIGQLVSIIEQMNGGLGPDILGVCEIENAFVLDRLVDRLNERLNHRTYARVHVDATLDHRGIDTAFIFDSSRYHVDPLTIFSHFVMRRTGTRDITQVTFTTSSGQELIAMCNHWPSRSGAGTQETQGFRMTAGETLAYWHERIWEEKGNKAAIIAMGDFNDDPFDQSIQTHARATRERGDVERSVTAVRFYNLAWNYMEQTAFDLNGDTKSLNGTLYFRGNGNVFDQLFVSKGLLLDDQPLSVMAETARIEAFPEMVDARVSYGPIRFGLPKGNVDKHVNLDGFSDHFPVSVEIFERVG